MSTKSIHQLRTTCQGMDIKFAFNDDMNALQQKIDLKLAGMVPKKIDVPERNPYDSRLRSKPPAKQGTEETLREVLTEHIKLGLILTFPHPEEWHMRVGVKEDTGNMRAPLRDLVAAADRLMR